MTMSDEPFAPFERDTPDHLDAVRHIAEGHAEQLAEGNFTPALMFMDDEESPRAIVFPDIDGTEETKNQLAWAMRILSAAIDDLWSIAFVVDTYHASTKKHDGSEWGPNEMGYAFENKTVDADLVTEALTYQMIAGDRFFITTVPYKRDNGEIEFLWDDVITLDESDDAKFGGFYPDALRGLQCAQDHGDPRGCQDGRGAGLGPRRRPPAQPVRCGEDRPDERRNPGHDPLP
jgi:hypothetical protein